MNPRAVLISPDGLLRRAVMDGTNIASWFKKASASKWQQGLMDLISKGLQDGIQETANTVRRALPD